MESKLFNLSLSLKVIVGISIILWAFIALFPLLWVFIMSIKLPIDSFAANPLNVIIGPNTLKQVGGLSFINLICQMTHISIIPVGMPGFQRMVRSKLKMAAL